MAASFGSGIPIGVSLVYLVYFVLPGIVFVKAVERGERVVENLNRLDKLGYVMAGGTASMFVFLIFDFLLSLGNSAPLLRVTSVTAFPAIVVVGGVIVQSTIAAIGGDAFGRLQHRRRNPRNARRWEDREQPWKYISDKIRQEQVTVITKGGDTLRGIVSRYGSGSDAGDLTLGSPRFIKRKGDTEIVKDRYGNEAFISRDDIAQIHYEDKEYPLDDDVERKDNGDSRDEKADDVNDGKLADVMEDARQLLRSVRRYLTRS